VTSLGKVRPDPSGSGFDVAGYHIYKTAGTYHPSIVIQSYDGAGVKVTSLVIVSAGPGLHPDFLRSGGTTIKGGAGSSTGPFGGSPFTDSGAAPPSFSAIATVQPPSMAANTASQPPTYLGSNPFSDRTPGGVRRQLAHHRGPRSRLDPTPARLHARMLAPAGRRPGELTGALAWDGPAKENRA
jgi:hypothetical protein